MRSIPIAPSDALYKIQLLTGRDYKTLSSWITETLADYLLYNHYLRYELFLELQIYFKHPKQYKKKEFFEELRQRVLAGYNETVSLNEWLKVHLFNLKIRTDEIGISTMKDFDKKILKDKRIKEILEEVERDYKKLK